MIFLSTVAEAIKKDGKVWALKNASSGLTHFDATEKEDPKIGYLLMNLNIGLTDSRNIAHELHQRLTKEGLWPF
ncbi:MAG: hypothetical protein ACFCD0_20825 [Gemmataceae bacterium]